MKLAIFAVFLVVALSFETDAKPGNHKHPNIRESIHKAILPYLCKIEKDLEKLATPLMKQEAKDAIHKDLLALKEKLNNANFDKFEKEIFAIIDDPKHFHFPTLSPSSK